MVIAHGSKNPTIEDNLPILCKGKPGAVTYTIRYYQGNEEYQNCTIQVKISLEYLLKKWSKVPHFTSWINDYGKMLEYLKVGDICTKENSMIINKLCACKDSR